MGRFGLYPTFLIVSKFITEKRIMKSTGIIRAIDELGRIVIPKEIRKKLDFADKAPIEIFVDDENVILKKYVPACIFCGGEDVVVFKDKKICRACISALRTED